MAHEPPHPRSLRTAREVDGEAEFDEAYMGGKEKTSTPTRSSMGLMSPTEPLHADTGRLSLPLNGSGVAWQSPHLALGPCREDARNEDVDG